MSSNPIAKYENGWKTFWELFILSVYRIGSEWRVSYEVYNGYRYVSYDKKLYTDCEHPYFIHDKTRLRLEDCIKIDVTDGIVMYKGDSLSLADFMEA